MRPILLLILLIAISPGCDIEKREAALTQREAEINEREQQLILRENSVEAREEQVMLKEKIYDSTLHDSARFFNSVLPGQWSVKMVCTETTCTGSAVGDTKNENWIFSYENNIIVVRAMVADKLARTYTGSFVNTAVELVENVDPSASAPATRIIVRLNIGSTNNITGQREIVRPDCKIVYSLQLTK